MPEQTIDLIARRIRHDIVAMHAYAVQDARGMVKLDAMENPYTLAPAMQQKLGQRLGALALNRYPDGRINVLRSALATYAQMPEGYDIMLGNGSDELISLLAIAGSVAGASILAPVPGFVMYALSAQLHGLGFHGVPLTPDFELDEPAMIAAIRAHQPAIVYLAYPNNPTANLWDDVAIANIIAEVGQQGGLVVMDEAYLPFSSRTWLDRIRAQPSRHGHVLLMRTLSKFGLAGVRLGYLMGPKALIAEVDKVRPPYNISVLNCECALFALENVDVFMEQALDLKAHRAIILEALAALPGVFSWNSEANMILIRVPDASATFERMKSQGVLIKNVSRSHPLLNNCLRLTVGTAFENQQMLDALKRSL